MTLTHKSRRAVLAIGAAGALVMAGGGMAVASYSGVASSGQIHVCWKNSPGGIRIVDHFPCKPGETALSWNQKGVQGAAGSTGADGAVGEAGADGTDGTAGVDGASSAGSTGATGPAGAAGPAGPTGATGAAGAAGEPGLDGAPGAPGAKGDQGEAGPAGSASLSTSPIYKDLQGCSMYGSSRENVVPTRAGGQEVAVLGSVTQTAPGEFHLSGLDVSKTYQVSACSYGYVTYQPPRADGTLEVTLRGYDSSTQTYNGMDANGVAIVVHVNDGSNLYVYGSTLALTAPAVTP